jgi:subtilisin family serine protease
MEWSGHVQVTHASSADYNENQITVTLTPGTDIASFNAAHGTNTVHALPDEQTYVLALPVTESADAVASQWANDPSITTVEPNYTVDLLASDQFYLEFDQFYLEFQGSGFPSTAQGQWALSTIAAPTAQSINSGRGVTVAELDTGVDPTHPALSSHLAMGGYDYVSQTATMSDVVGGPASGHGTFVAGLIAQVAPAARILPFRVLNSSGLGTVASVADAIESAVNDGARVINMSMGTPIPSATLLHAILYAQQHDVVVVASAGNQNTSTPQYPAAWSGVVAVAGTDQNDQRAFFSNYGPWISVSAPAISLYSTYPNGFAYGSGTSFAAPLVSGEAALLRSAQPTLTSTNVVDAIAQGSVDINDLNPAYEDMLGAGRINALSALTTDDSGD